MVLQDRDAAVALREIGVDAIELVDYVDFIFAENNERELTFRETGLTRGNYTLALRP